MTIHTLRTRRELARLAKPYAGTDVRPDLVRFPRTRREARLHGGITPRHSRLATRIICVLIGMLVALVATPVVGWLLG